MARSAFYKFKKVLCNNEFNINIRIRFIKCYIWSILLYGMESWTLKKSSLLKLQAFEMWTYRRILKITWRDRVSNEEVLRRINGQKILIQTVKRRKTAYFGHLMRNNKYDLLKLIIQGKVEGIFMRLDFVTKDFKFRNFGRNPVLLVCDGCGGQNKNSIMVTMTMYWLNKAPNNIKRLELVFPVTGRSFISPERVFGIPEKQFRKIEVIALPDEYLKIIKTNSTVKAAEEFKISTGNMPNLI